MGDHMYNVNDWVKSKSDGVTLVGKINHIKEIPMIGGDVRKCTAYIINVKYSNGGELVWLDGDVEVITEEEAMLYILQGANDAVS